MSLRNLLLVLPMACAFAHAVRADDEKAAVFAPALVVPAPPGVEKSAGIERSSALNGNGALYTVAFPIANPRDPAPIAVGYIRLANVGATDGSMQIQVVGLQTGRLYGTVTYVMPARVSYQFAQSRVLDDANIAGPADGDAGFAYWLKASNPLMGFMLIAYNEKTLAFENMTHCQFLPGTDYTWMNGVLTNVHTTTIASYPSFINIYNTYDHAVTYKFDVYDAATGASLGSTTQLLQPNTAFGFNSGGLQTRIGFTPSATQPHMNVFVTPVTPASQNVLAHHNVVFTGAQGFLPTAIAMSNFCPITQ